MMYMLGTTHDKILACMLISFVCCRGSHGVMASVFMCAVSLFCFPTCRDLLAPYISLITCIAYQFRRVFFSSSLLSTWEELKNRWSEAGVGAFEQEGCQTSSIVLV